MTVNILRENQIDPKTDPTKGTWADFLKTAAKSLWQCDFFSKHLVTAQGIRQCFVLAFIHVQTRRVWLSPCSFKPDVVWMRTQAEGFLAHAKAQGLETGVAPSKTGEVVCRERLGGMLRHYERAAAAA